MPALWLCEPFTDTDRICRSDRNVPFHFTKLFSPGPLICILHDNQTRGGFGLVCATGMCLPLGKWFFRNFKQEFLFNGKSVKCLRRNVGPARRLTLPLQKGDWTSWVTLLAESTFCNLNGSPCFVKKCVRRCLFQESSGRRVTFLLETNFLQYKRGLNFSSLH